jgi:hypothetical protein
VIVSELGQALELLHTSTTRWRSIRAAGREWRHSARAWEAWQRSVPPQSSAVTYLGAPEDEPKPEETEERWWLWQAKPDRTRAEFVVQGETLTAVVLGETWWSWSPTQGAMTNAGDPHSSQGTGPSYALIEPAPILPAVDLQVTSRSSFLGRTVLEVVARPSVLDEDDEEADYLRGATHGLGSGADEYRLLIDAERGVLLRAEAVIGGAPFRILEMNAVAFDEDFPEDTFAPPDVPEIERLEPYRSISFADLPGAVPFDVFVPDRPPFGPPHVRVESPNRRYGIPLQVHIDYSSPLEGEEDRRFWLIESADPITDRDWVEWREEAGIRLGEDLRVRPVLRIARLERGGTHVEIQSYELTMEVLRDLARALVPLPSTPPALS